MARARAALAIGLAIAAGAVALSGRSDDGLRASWALPGLPGPLLGKEATQADRRWLRHARPLDEAAPEWARRLYLRSLLVLRALTDRRRGAVAAGFRDGWAYVWPRDASAVAIAFASAGYPGEARRVVHFLLTLDLDAAARFSGTGVPVPGRDAQGDATGWVIAAARAAGIRLPASRHAWRDLADYQEKDPGDYVANAIASSAPVTAFRAWRGLVRVAGDPASGLDSAVAWGVRPFPHHALFPTIRRSLRRLLAERKGRFGIVPSEDWPNEDPWTAPTAWTAWAFAALATDERASGRPVLARSDRRTALRLIGDLRRAATPLGLLPERVDAHTGIPRSTTPLAWSHAFAVLALRQLWP